MGLEPLVGNHRSAQAIGRETEPRCFWGSETARARQAVPSTL